MANKSVNQNRHLYVAKAYSASVDGTSAVGTIGGVKTIGQDKEKQLIIAYKGADSTMMTDRIDLRNLDYAKAFKASDMVEPLKSVKVTLDPDVNEGKVVAGQDYLLRITFFGWVSPSPMYQYVKDGAVRATSAMIATPLKFYEALAESLNLAFAREVGASKTSNPYLKFEAAANGLTITEKEQGWALGTEQQERIDFLVQPTTVFVDGIDAVWGKVTDITPAKYVEDTDSSSSTYQQMIPNPAVVAGTNAIGNGKKIADLEYFCMGERGDQYRMMGWPNVIPTKYLVDPERQYNVLEIHHAYTDEGTNSYRSEKDITIVAEDASVLNSLIGAINTVAGTQIAILE